MMPRFVSDHVHPHGTPYNKKRDDDEDEIDIRINESQRQQQLESSKIKPSAINKRGTKEKQKNSLDLFKEELKRFQDEQKNQRYRKRKKFARKSATTSNQHPSFRSSSSLNMETLVDLLMNLDPTRSKIGETMLFCINHSDAAPEIIDCIHGSLSLIETPLQKKLARLFLISDVLHNCSASVTNASYYRKGFQTKLISIFEHLREYLLNIEDHHKADKFKQKVLRVLGAWKEWTLYEDDYVIQLSDILLGLTKRGEQSSKIISNPYFSSGVDLTYSSQAPQKITTLPILPTLPPSKTSREDDLDGIELNDETLGKLLEAKGLSIRWYKTLNLSEDELDESQDNLNKSRSGERSESKSPVTTTKNSAKSAGDFRFKTSKWETVDPNEVAEQVVTISKCRAMAAREEEGEDDSDLDNDTRVGAREGDGVRVIRKENRSNEPD